MIDNFFIRNTVQTKLQDAIYEIQQRYNIHSGDVEPLVQVKYDEAECNLIEMVTKIINDQVWNEKTFAPNLGFSEANWQSCLESLGFVEQKNPNGADCFDIYEDGIPRWQYEGQEQQKNLYHFFLGMVTAQFRKDKTA